MDIQKLFIHYLFSFIGMPYLWGKRDCSWFAQEMLAFFGLDPKGDQTANDLYQHFLLYGKRQQVPDLGCLLFFGKPDKINHVAVALNGTHMIEFGGGDSTTLTEADAIKRGHAMGRVRLIENRKDLVDTIKPNGLPW